MCVPMLMNEQIKPISMVARTNILHKDEVK